MSKETDLGELNYMGYVKSSGGVSLVSGEPLPAWGEQDPKIREAWRHGAHYVAAEVVNPDAEDYDRAAELLAVRDERDKLQRGAQTLGKVVERQARDLYAMWIDVSLGDLEAVKERILNAMPDGDDNEPGEQWNGAETGSEWLDRTRDQS